MLQILYKKNIIIILSVIVIGITTFLIIKNKTKENITIPNILGFIGINNNNDELTLVDNSNIDLKDLNSLPVGVIAMWTNNNKIPTGWALCDGTIKNNIQTPDLRGRFIVGYSKANNTASESIKIYREPNSTTSKVNTYKVVNGDLIIEYTSNQTGGVDIQSLTENQMPKHDHSSYQWKNIIQFGTAGSGINWSDFGDTTPSIADRGNNKNYDNRPPYYALLYIIKIK